MACTKYRVYEYDSQEVPHDTGKEFFVSDKEHAEMRHKMYGVGSSPGYDAASLLYIFFDKVFKFTIPSGHTVSVVDNDTIDIVWKGKVWRLCRISSKR